MFRAASIADPNAGQARAGIGAVTRSSICAVSPL